MWANRESDAICGLHNERKQRQYQWHWHLCPCPLAFHSSLAHNFAWHPPRWHCQWLQWPCWRCLAFVSNLETLLGMRGTYYGKTVQTSFEYLISITKLFFKALWGRNYDKWNTSSNWGFCYIRGSTLLIEFQFSIYGDALLLPGGPFPCGSQRCILRTEMSEAEVKTAHCFVTAHIRHRSRDRWFPHATKI